MSADALKVVEAMSTSSADPARLHVAASECAQGTSSCEELIALLERRLRLPGSHDRLECQDESEPNGELARLHAEMRQLREDHAQVEEDLNLSKEMYWMKCQDESEQSDEIARLHDEMHRLREDHAQAEEAWRRREAELLSELAVARAPPWDRRCKATQTGFDDSPEGNGTGMQRSTSTTTMQRAVHNNDATHHHHYEERSTTTTTSTMQRVRDGQSEDSTDSLHQPAVLDVLPNGAAKDQRPASPTPLRKRVASMPVRKRTNSLWCDNQFAPHLAANSEPGVGLQATVKKSAQPLVTSRTLQNELRELGRCLEESFGDVQGVLDEFRKAGLDSEGGVTLEIFEEIVKRRWGFKFPERARELFTSEDGVESAATVSLEELIVAIAPFLKGSSREVEAMAEVVLRRTSRSEKKK